MEEDSGPLAPGSILVSNRVAVPARAEYVSVRRALAAIDAVHSDGDLPVLPVGRTRSAVEAGAYEWSDHTGEPLRLRLSSLGTHPELTVVHEIGHFLDHQALDRAGTFASETGTLSALMQVIESTEAVVALRGRRRVMIVERGRREIEPVRQPRVEYLLQPRELFARAYAQFVARRSHDPQLEFQFTSVRSDRQGRVYHDFWADVDFMAVERALLQVFGRRRWMRSR